MADEYSNALGRLDYLEFELTKTRKLGLLGETGPGVANGRKDEQAEKIENIIAVAKRELSQSQTRDESNSELSYAWYSIRGILRIVFAPKKIGLTKHVDAYVSSALDIMRTTAQFRKRYEFIYRAAFYAILPMRTVTKEIHPLYKEIQAYFLYFNGIYRANLNFPSRLDSGHLLDQSLVSLSGRVAKVLDVTWKQRQVVDALSKVVVERAGDLFQDILVQSQSDSMSRAAAPLFLKDVSRMIEILETCVNEGKSNNMSFVASLDRRWRDKCASEWIMSVPKRQTQDSVLGLITRMRYLKTHITQGNTLDTPRALGNDLTPENISRDDYTFTNIAERMENHCAVEKFYGRVDRQTFSSGVRLSEGSYASVRRVRLDEERSIGHSWRFNEVAVKILRRTGPEHVVSLRAFREFIIWSQMKHPNIVPLIGLWFDFGYDTGLPAFVSPWIEHGSLLRYLSNRPNMDRAERLHLLLGVANALAYMHNHQPCVCHGDINPENILVSNGDAFVCDFGISHISEPYRGLTTDPHGDWRYRAPEQLLGESTPTPQSDMYSFGLLCYKVLTCLEPWHAISEAGRLNNPNVIMPCPDSMLADDYNFLVYCWMTDPRLRPTASIAVSSLRELVE